MSSKLQKVLKILENEELRSWYAVEHGLTGDMLTEGNVKVYGRGGFGLLADQILRDGVELGLPLLDE